MNMDDGCNTTEFYSIIKTAAIIAIIIAIAITGYLFIFTEEQHSSLYIIPESYQNQAVTDRISFTYGVTCSEQKATDYEIQINLNDKIMATEQFQLDNNENYEKNEELLLTENISYPAKIQVLLTNKNNMNTEEVHFWIE
ncbi:hypothetical protein L1S32_03065 [Methanogenium sp. S4BF]|uniref:hypothetical protein n=1 Tax=Methanogenium sp. S4BF TaxID=1789226 RepID=UPI002415B6B6|nr:hypothetical protein [Methanogenium sp. S4BF]WFN35115.1 hypothetical protein L1S32_03065 [Methanogenium sp. S4BF]